MITNVVSEIALAISNRLGVQVSAESETGRNHVSLRHSSFPRPYGFTVDVKAGLAVLTARVEFDRLSVPLLDKAASSTEENWRQFVAHIESLTESGLGVNIKVNGARPDGKPTKVKDLHVEVKVFNWSGEFAQQVLDVASIVYGLMDDLLQDESSVAGDVALGDIEGAKYRIAVSRYERSQANRLLAISMHGDTCLVCGFNFGDTYGAQGMGYVEIHHLNSLHLLEEARAIDVASELVPLCANCHRMAHRKDPPYSPDDLRNMITRVRGINL